MIASEIANLMDSLGWAILHSSWQGTLAVIAVILFRAVTKDSQASVRYGFEIFSLIGCLLAFIITFAIYYTPASSSTLPAMPLELSSGPMSQIFPSSGATHGTLGTTHMSSASNIGQYIPYLGLLWCLGFTFMALRYTAAFALTQRLRKVGLSDAPIDWQNRFSTLVVNAGLRRKVDIFVSSHVSGPLTLGFFKPLVLVPAGFFGRLPAEQIEAILLHEIAHIRRHDYLFNLLQTIIRTIFFFHPAIHFISRKMDHDREHACDDFAVATTHNPQALAKALATLRLSLKPNPFAMAAEDGNTPLVNRLKRLAGSSDTRKRPEHVVTSAFALTIAAGLYLAASPLADAHPVDARAETNIINEQIFDDQNITLHSNAKLKNYKFEKVIKGGKSFTVKVTENGTRWVNVKGTWIDIDKNPSIIQSIPKAPQPPAPLKLKSNESWSDQKVQKVMDNKLNQHLVDLDYYVASLENSEDLAGGPDLSRALSEAEDMRDAAIHNAKKTKRSQGPQIHINGTPSGVHIDDAFMQTLQEKRAKITMDLNQGLISDEQADDAYDRIDDKFDSYIDSKLEAADIQMEAALDKAEREHERALECAECDRMKAIEKADRQRELALKQAERDRQNILKQAELQRHKSFKQVEHERKKSLQKTQYKHDGLSERELALKSLTKTRLAERKARERAHEEAFHVQEDFKEYRDLMLSHLKADGLIAQNAQQVVITYPEGKMHVDGNPVPDDLEGHYCEMNKGYHISKDKGAQIKITLDRIDMVNSEFQYKNTTTRSWKFSN